MSTGRSFVDFGRDPLRGDSFWRDLYLDHLADPARERPSFFVAWDPKPPTVLGMPVHADPGLEPGTAELRGEHGMVRVIGLATEGS
ncbi:MAG TPA: hypothetical protein VIU16_01925 [Gaiellaceae bacterium]